MTHAAFSRKIIVLGARFFPLFWWCLVSCATPSKVDRKPEQQRSAEIMFQHQKILYVIAHPDDEDPGLLAWLARRVHAEVGILVLTHGEGGENLLGPELGEPLGLIRLQEQLQANQKYGVKHLMTLSLPDFGYTRDAALTLKKWGDAKALGGLLGVLHAYAPTMVISRFQGTDQDGHGHHQAAGLLVQQAMRATGANLPPSLKERLAHIRWLVQRRSPSGKTLTVEHLMVDGHEKCSYARLGHEGYAKHATQSDVHGGLNHHKPYSHLEVLNSNESFGDAPPLWVPSPIEVLPPNGAPSLYAELGSRVVWGGYEQWLTSKALDVEIRIINQSDDRAEMQIKAKPTKGWVADALEPIWLDAHAQLKIKWRWRYDDRVSPAGDTAYALPFELRRIAASGQNEMLPIISWLGYAHTGPIPWHIPAEVKVHAIQLTPSKSKVAYVMGSGDVIPDVLKAMAMQVVKPARHELVDDYLNAVDTVVMGHQAYDSHADLSTYEPALIRFMQRGGRVVLLHQTSGRRRLPFEGLLKDVTWDGGISNPAAPARMTASHTIWKYPNVIKASDFDGWVFDRAQRIWSNWQRTQFPLMTITDDKGQPQSGALVVTKVGRGELIYTGLTFYRQLAEGVPGATRLFVNLCSQQRALHSAALLKTQLGE